MLPPYPKKSQEWAVTGVEYLPEQLLDRLERGLDRILKPIPWPVPYTDLEVVGSYGCNCARPGSDLDITVRFPTMADCRAAWALYRSMDRNNYVARKNALRHELGIVIQVGIRNHDSRDYWPVYSLRERRLFNRQPGEV